MNDLKIVGWINYDSDCENYRYPKEELSIIVNLVIDEIKKTGLSFSGETHQSSIDAVPLFNNGKCFRASMRAWAKIMAEAHNDESYMNYYMASKDEILPEQGKTSSSMFVKDGDSFLPFICKQDLDLMVETISMGMDLMTTDKVLLYIFPLLKEKLGQ